MTFKTIEFRDNINGKCTRHSLRYRFFVHFFSGGLHNVTANKEVILSAGSVNTPVILMYSGIGNSTLLSSLSIPTLVDLPAVGQNLTDHVGVSSTWRVNSTRTFDTVLRNQTLEDALVKEWTENKTGIMVDTSENHAAWLRAPDNSSVWDMFDDPAAGNVTAHYEFLFQVRDEHNMCQL